MRKILIGGVVAGFAVFVWSAFAHMVLPLGDAGIGVIPNEDAVIASLKGAIHEPGFYFFPGEGAGKNATPEQKRAWQAKYAKGPRGILVYHPDGAPAMSPAGRVGGVEINSHDPDQLGVEGEGDERRGCGQA
ncbi:MAG: hypothetical protein V1750_11540 [Acidobacteriota bacterium]